MIAFAGAPTKEYSVGYSTGGYSLRRTDTARNGTVVCRGKKETKWRLQFGLIKALHREHSDQMKKGA
jgi:hypothetical protein